MADRIAKVLRTVIFRVLVALQQAGSSKSRREYMYELADEEAAMLFRPKKVVQAIQSMYK